MSPNEAVWSLLHCPLFLITGLNTGSKIVVVVVGRVVVVEVVVVVVVVVVVGRVVVVTTQLAVYERVGSTPGMSVSSVTQKSLSCEPPDFLELYLHLILSPFASAGAE